MRPESDVRCALDRLADGLTPTEVARQTGIPSIHSDGTRIVAVERKGGRVRHAPRYAFSNLSEEILGLFREACDVVGVHTTRPSVKQVAVYRKASVAILDGFIGPKS